MRTFPEILAFALILLAPCWVIFRTVVFSIERVSGKVILSRNFRRISVVIVQVFLILIALASFFLLPVLNYMLACIGKPNANVLWLPLTLYVLTAAILNYPLFDLFKWHWVAFWLANLLLLPPLILIKSPALLLVFGTYACIWLICLIDRKKVNSMKRDE